MFLTDCLIFFLKKKALRAHEMEPSSRVYVLLFASETSATCF